MQKPDGTYSNDNVFPKWREKYPEPPDVIGVKRNYTYAIDRPSQKANQALVASIPQDHKQVQILKSSSSIVALHSAYIRALTYKNSYQGIKIKLRPYGFTGFKLDELTPNKTRRAQCVKWLLFYL